MKKVQRSFAVEYKSGRRKHDAKPNSIWGTMDLKSVARDVEEEVMPLLRGSPAGDEPALDMPTPTVKPDLSVLPPLATSTTAAEARGMSMADDTDANNDAEAPAFEEAPVAPNRQRKPRVKRISPVEAAADTVAETTTGSGSLDAGKNRISKATVTKGRAVSQRTFLKRGPKADQTTDDVATPAGNESTDLLQLEEENQKLRKLLAEKLRRENADLRTKLKVD